MQGKNATDSAMITDVMDLLYNNRLDGFRIVSSHSEFIRLVSGIRNPGLVVYGFGERKTPEPFISACGKFIHIENILKQEQLSARRRVGDLAKVGGLITKQHSDIYPRTYGYTKLGDLVVATGMFYTSRNRPAEGKAMVVYARDKPLGSSSTAS